MAANLANEASLDRLVHEGAVGDGAAFMTFQDETSDMARTDNETYLFGITGRFDSKPAVESTQNKDDETMVTTYRGTIQGKEVTVSATSKAITDSEGRPSAFITGIEARRTETLQDNSTRAVRIPRAVGKRAVAAVNRAKEGARHIK